MDQSRSWEANRSSATQEISRILWNVEVYYRIRKSPPFVPVLSQIDPIHVSHPTSRIYVFVSSSHLRLGLPSGFFPLDHPTKTLYAPFLAVMRATFPAHPSLFTLSPKWYSVRSTEHKAPCYVVFSTPLLPHPLGPNILLTRFSRKPSACVSPSMWVHILTVFAGLWCMYYRAFFSVATCLAP
jgi:hypothetical protein